MGQKEARLTNLCHWQARSPRSHFFPCTPNSGLQEKYESCHGLLDTGVVIGTRPLSDALTSRQAFHDPGIWTSLRLGLKIRLHHWYIICTGTTTYSTGARLQDLHNPEALPTTIRHLLIASCLFLDDATSRAWSWRRKVTFYKTSSAARHGPDCSWTVFSNFDLVASLFGMPVRS